MKDTPEQKAFWSHVERTALEVEKWPLWMRGGVDAPRRLEDIISGARCRAQRH